MMQADTDSPLQSATESGNATQGIASRAATIVSTVATAVPVTASRKDQLPVHKLFKIFQLQNVRPDTEMEVRRVMY